MLGPPLLIGEKVFYTKHGFIASGTVKWLGRLQEVFGNQMVAGVLMVREINHKVATLHSYYLSIANWYCMPLSGIPFFSSRGLNNIPYSLL